MSLERQSNSVTADSVAKLAGVSRWTVSRAFKKDSSISASSFKKVMDAAGKLGYFPDLLAASLASDRSNLVSLLIDDFANPHKLVMMENLTRFLRENGWGTLLVNTLNDDDASAALLHASQRRVDAAVLIGSNFNDKALAAAQGAKRVKKLIVFARNSSNPDTISICCDDEIAMATMTDHVLEKGYERPLFVAGPQTPSAHLLRKETFLRQWRDARGHTPPHLTVDIYDPWLAHQRVSVYFTGLNRKNWPDILVCENDALAMGAVDAVRHDFGLRVPDDIAVTGFDDAPQAANPNYYLTTYRQPIQEMCGALVDVLTGDLITQNLSAFSGHLVTRNSA